MRGWQIFVLLHCLKDSIVGEGSTHFFYHLEPTQQVNIFLKYFAKSHTICRTKKCHKNSPMCKKCVKKWVTKTLQPFPTILANSSQFQPCPANSSQFQPFPAVQSIQSIHSYLQPFKPFLSIHSHLQSFPNIYRNLHQFKQCTDMFCHVGHF